MIAYGEVVFEESFGVPRRIDVRIVHGISWLMVTGGWPLVLPKLSLKGKAIEQAFNGFKRGVRIDLLLSSLLPLESSKRQGAVTQSRSSHGGEMHSDPRSSLH